MRMIPQSIRVVEKKSWQQELAASSLQLDHLLEVLQLSTTQLSAAGVLPLTDEARAFPLRVPESYLSRIEPGNPLDPLLLQVLPSAHESLNTLGFNHDPVGESAANPLPGLIHKYHGRVLLIAAGACAIHCRYCFRRHFPYADNLPTRDQIEQVARYIEADNSIEEVILSGGDPLAANDQHLGRLIERLAQIPHLTRLRIHTRLPVVIPQRVTNPLLEILTASRLQPIVVLHSNHPREIDQEVAESCVRLHQKGVTLLNQSVLLKNINDSADILCELSEKLFRASVLPYYLHLLDPVAGAEHFFVKHATALAIHGQMQNRLSGYLVPKLVQEIAGKGAKQLVASANLGD